MRINPSTVPYILFKAVLKYPLYFLTLLLFVKNVRALTKLFQYRNSDRELDCRFGLGRHRLNGDDILSFAELILHGIYCYRAGERVIARFQGGYVSSPNVRHLSFLLEPYEKQYRVFGYAGRVLDVGGYLGETALLFKRWGATEVVVYEPDPTLARHARETMLLNSVKGVVHELFVNCPCEGKSVSWAEVLKEKFEVAKVDCEGCENGLLKLSDDCIRRVPKWVIECHGQQTLRQLGEKFLRAGFTVTFRPQIWKGGYYVIGHERTFQPQAEVPEVSLFIMTARLS